MIGTTLSHYRIVEELGRGGMGIVYKAEDTKLDRTVAIKVLPAAALASEEDRARFYREAKAAAALNHPNIAAIHQIDEAIATGDDGAQIEASDGPRPFIAMEFIEGGTLEDRIKAGPLKLAEAVKIATQVAEALRAAHAKDIVHRDIKSANIMLTKDGAAKVLDFGLAQTSASTKLTRMGSTLGTVAYMSPEQARGEEVDGRTDLYSLGTVLYEMIAGRLPFGGEYEQAVVYSILNAEPEPLTALRTGVPMELERIANKLLAKDAAYRYQTAADLTADLKALQLGSAVSHTGLASRPSLTPAGPNPGMGSPSEKGPSRSWPTLAALIVVASLLGAAATWLLTRPEQAMQRFHISSVDDLIHARLAPDGSSMVWTQRDTLFYRPFSSPNASRIYQADDIEWLAWAPDSRSVAIVEGRDVTNVRVDGSGSFPIGRLPPSERVQGVVWTPTGRVFVAIQYGGANGEIFEFPASGGEGRSYIQLSTAAGNFSTGDLAWLPGPEVLIGVTRDFTNDQIRVIKPESESERRLSEALVEATETTVWMSSIAYDPSGALVYERGGDLWQLPIDKKSGMPRGEPTVLLGKLTGPSIAADGSLLAHDFGAPYEEVRARLFDPVQGTTTTPGITMRGRVMYPVFHPDGDRIVVSSPEGAKLASLARGDAQRISDNFAVISQWVNARVLIVSDYGTGGNANILQLDPTSRGEPGVLIASEMSEFYGEVSPDGSTFLYYIVDEETGRDLWTVPVALTERELTVAGEPSEWFSGSNDDAAPTWHPSGAWVAYMSNETGRFQIYVRSWPDGLTTELVSLGEGMTPLWSEDGRSLYYRDTDSLYVATVRNEGQMRFDRPRGLFSLQDVAMVLSTPLERPFAVRPGTGELLYFQSNAPNVVPKLILVENWASAP